MKNKMLKKIGGMAMAILMFAIFAQVRVIAQDAKTEEPSKEETSENNGGENRNAEKLVGTWNVQVTIRNCQTGAALRTFASTTTYMLGGIMIDSTSGTPQALKTPGHGVWSYSGGRNYRLKFKNFNFDAAGNFTGWFIIKHDAHLNRQADEIETSGTLEIYAPNGNLIATGCSTTTGERFE